MAEALRHFEGQRYALGAFVVMPNHVHVIFRPAPEHELEDILQSWKSFTAKKINKLLGKTGTLWQAEYWDRMMRNERQLAACLDYIEANPVMAGLHAGEFVLEVKI